MMIATVAILLQHARAATVLTIVARLKYARQENSVMNQQAEIVFEKEETILLRQSAATMNEFCPFCDAVSVMATPEAVTLMTGVSEREIFRLIETGDIHFYDGPKVYVCLNSLSAVREKRGRQIN